MNLDDTLSVAEKQAALTRATREHTVQADPDDVRPPLSRAERPFAVNELGLTWMPASSVYDLAMSSGLQGASEDSGGLVLTGTAGSTYRFLVHAARMRDQWGLDLDLGLIRAGMIAMSLSAGHHSFHEVMRGAQLALDSLPGHDPVLDYQDNWGRYWNVHPLTEQELREHVARDGRFPDEHAQEVLDADTPAPALNSAPSGGRAVPTGPDADLDTAWEEHRRARSAFGAAAVGGSPEALAEVDRARGLLEQAEQRLWVLGVAPDALGAARTADDDQGDATGPLTPAPAVSRDTEQRRYIAEQLTADDLLALRPRARRRPSDRTSCARRAPRTPRGCAPR